MRHGRLLLVSLAMGLTFSPTLAVGRDKRSAKPNYCSVDANSNNPTCAYPDSLKGSGIQGKVVLRLVVLQNGCTRDITVVRKLHPQLDKIATECVESWRLSPAKKDGKPVMVMIDMEVEFREP